MVKFSQKTKKLLTSSLLPILVSLIFVAAVIFAFTEPIVVPPGGNVPAPLNVGPSGQTKEGGLILNTGGAATGLIVQSGNVGIGTTSPGYKLEVFGGDINIVNPPAVSSILRFASGGATTTYIKEQWGLEVHGSATQPVQVPDASLIVGYNSAGGNYGTGNLFVAGNVGIGTTDPSLGGRVGSRFTVVSGGTAFAAAANSTTPSFAVNTEGGAWRMYDWAAGGWRWSLYSNSGSVAFGGNIDMVGGDTFFRRGRLHIQADENIYLNPWRGGTVFVGGGGGPGVFHATGGINTDGYLRRRGYDVCTNAPGAPGCPVCVP